MKYLQKRFPDKLQPGQTLQFKLADMQIQVEGARQTLHHTMQLRDAGVPVLQGIGHLPRPSARMWR